MIVAIGMDPGPKPGLVKLTYSEGLLIDVAVVQCTANVALDVLQMWLEGLPKGACLPPLEAYFGVERYVDRAKGRSSAAGNRTKDLVGSSTVLATTHGAWANGNTASRVKAWATEGRLLAAGLLEPTRGMAHARDAARHALFAAVHDGKCPDPYSRKARRTDG